MQVLKTNDDKTLCYAENKKEALTITNLKMNERIYLILVKVKGVVASDLL